MDRQFSQIMSHTKQPPLNIHLFQSPEHKSTKFHVVFDIPENGFWLDTA